MKKELQSLSPSENSMGDVNKLLIICSAKEVVQLAELRDKAIRNGKNRLSGAKEEGKFEGKVEGKVEILIKLLTRKFKAIPEGYKEKLIKIPEEKIEVNLLNIFQIKKLEDLDK